LETNLTEIGFVAYSYECEKGLDFGSNNTDDLHVRLVHMWQGCSHQPTQYEL